MKQKLHEKQNEQIFQNCQIYHVSTQTIQYVKCNTLKVLSMEKYHF